MSAQAHRRSFGTGEDTSQLRTTVVKFGFAWVVSGVVGVTVHTKHEVHDATGLAQYFTFSLPDDLCIGLSADKDLCWPLKIPSANSGLTELTRYGGDERRGSFVHAMSMNQPLIERLFIQRGDIWSSVSH